MLEWICFNIVWKHVKYYIAEYINKQIYIYIYDPAPPCSPPPPTKGGIRPHIWQPCIGITICFVLILCMYACVVLSCLSCPVCLVCKYVRGPPARSTCHCFCVLHTKILHVHIMFPAPPCGWVWGGSYHLQPCIGITICFYWFMYDNYFVCIDLWFVCMYVYTCPSKVDMSLFLCLHTKILHVHIMFPAPPPRGWVGGGLTICSHV